VSRIAADSQAHRPFELVRYFTVTSLVVILLFTLLISTIVGMRTSALVLHKKEQYAQLLAENLNHQVMLRFVMPVTIQYNNISVGDARQAELLDSVVRSTIQGFQVQRVSILDLSGNIIYSTAPVYIGRISMMTSAFLQAAQGVSVSFLDPPRNFYDFGPDDSQVFKILSPMRDEKRFSSELGEPKAVFEITLDINEDFREVWLNQLMLIASLLLLMAFLFVILRSIVIRGSRIMDRRALELRRLEAQLNQSERLASLGRMVAGVAHEIRNPLGIVRSTAELLGSKVAEAHKKLALIIVEESTRLNRIVSEFLDFARPQQVSLKPGSIQEVLDRLFTFLAPELERQQVELRFIDQASAGTRVLQDEEQIYRAFLNVLTNSLQAMEGKEERRITVTVRPAWIEGKAVLSVVCDDNGPGFPPDYAAKMFEPFYTTKNHGTGLGLSIVKTTLEAHSGYIELGFSPEGGGRVIISLRLEN
jgi:signal transduction histidine kinase